MTTGRHLYSKVTKENTLEIFLDSSDTPMPNSQEVVVKIEATPLNPSDLASIFGPADLNSVRASGSGDSAKITADIAPPLMKLVKTRIDSAMRTGSEGAGVVIAAGDSPQAQALLGKVVSMAPGQMHAQYRCVHFAQCMVMPAGISAKQAASSFVNPLTALGMVETMRQEGHKALVHTAAASNLGQMLNRICISEGIDLVNIVRSEAQVKLLRDLGAKHIVDSSLESFGDDLVAAMTATGATLAFDAIGGGKLANTILMAMERVALSEMKHQDHYGSSVHKQLYIYGLLDLSPTILNRGFGFAWGIGGWLLPNFLQRSEPALIAKMQQRIASEIDTTFASHYSQEITLDEVVSLAALKQYNKRATGEKFLILPHKI